MADNKNLLTKLDELDQRYQNIEKQMADPEITCDTNKLIALSKEQGKLKNMVMKYREYKKTIDGINDVQQILDDSDTDEEFKQLAQQELTQLQCQRDSLIEQIQSNLVMADDDVINSVIMEIRAGTGGEEAALFVRDLYNMYLRYAENQKWKIEQLDFSPTEMGGFREVILGIKGDGVWAELGYEGGGHQIGRASCRERV